MKKILLIIFILGNLSCFKNDKPPRVSIDGVRRILNETSHQLEVMVNGENDTLKYSIAPNSFIEIKGKCFEGGGVLESCIIGWESLYYGSIIFDNERIQRFELESPLGCGGNKAINGDVWENCGYKLVENTETLQVFEYQVTDTDYHNAEIL